MRVSGSCHCGEIEYEGELDPEKVGICHCTDCQSLSASAYRVIAMISGETFRISKGRPRIYVKSAESGNRRRQAFCGNCGSGIYACEDSDTPAVFNIRTGTLHQRQKIEPRFECWWGSALPWVSDTRNTRKFDKNPG